MAERDLEAEAARRKAYYQSDTQAEVDEALADVKDEQAEQVTVKPDKDTGLFGSNK